MSASGWLTAATLLAAACAPAAVPCRGEPLDLNVRVESRYQMDGKRDLVDRAEAAWELEKAEVTLTGTVDGWPRSTFEIAMDAADDPVLQDAWAALRCQRWLELRAGRMKPPFGYEFMRGTGKLDVPERGAAAKFVADALGNDARQQGVVARGKLPFSLAYEAGVFDGPNYELPGFEPLELGAARLRTSLPGRTQVVLSVLGQNVWRQLEGWRRFHSSAFWDAALVTRPRSWVRAELEYFAGDDRLDEYLPEIAGDGRFVRASVRCLMEGTVTAGSAQLRPGVQVERVDSGAGHRLDVTPLVCLDLGKGLRVQTALALQVDEQTGDFGGTQFIAQLALGFSGRVESDTKKASGRAGSPTPTAQSED